MGVPEVLSHHRVIPRDPRNARIQAQASIAASSASFSSVPTLIRSMLSVPACRADEHAASL